MIESSSGAAGAKSVKLVALGTAVFEALLRHDLDEAREACGLALPAFYLEEAWLWQLRLEQIAKRPEMAEWVVRAVVAEKDKVVAHAGFHGPPDAAGVVEVGYTVIPEMRGQGYGKAALRALLGEAQSRADVLILRACVSPGNAASRAVIQSCGLRYVGEMWEDGEQELVFETAVGAR